MPGPIRVFPKTPRPIQDSSAESVHARRERQEFSPDAGRVMPFAAGPAAGDRSDGGGPPSAEPMPRGISPIASNGERRGGAPAIVGVGICFVETSSCLLKTRRRKMHDFDQKSP